MESLYNSVFFGVVLTLLSYQIGVLLKKKFKLAIFNPIFISVTIVIVTLLVFDIDPQSYKKGGDIISFLLTPATVCLAVPLYEQLHVLKKNTAAILAGIFIGVFSSLLVIFGFALLFSFDNQMFVTLLPKSITTAIGLGLSEELGGIPALTAATITITGIFGNMIAEPVLKLFRITEPVAKGVAIGSASHAAGTAKAIEIGEIEGAMSSLSIVICGLLTVVFAPMFANLIS